jgi:hypothetical protein
MEEGWLAWWRGDGLRECDWEQPPDMPEMWLWGHHVDMMFDRYSNDKASVVRDQLIDMFRRGSVGHGDLQELLADMLDPAKKTPWRLDLRRRRGNPGKLSNDDLQYLCFSYEQRVDELKSAGRASPVKTARGELAAEYKMTDEEIRAIIDRAQGKRVRKRAAKRAGRNRG